MPAREENPRINMRWPRDSPYDLQRDITEQSDSKTELNSKCMDLCDQGTDPEKMGDCVGYCERLLVNTAELQRYPYSGFYQSPYRAKTLLFEGVEDASENIDAAVRIPDAIDDALQAEPDAMAGFTPGRNKLVTRDSLNLLMAFSFGVGIIFLIFAFVSQRQEKIGHFYLPRPNSNRRQGEMQCA